MPDLRSRLEQGLIPPNDVLSAEAQESRARLLAIESSNTRAVAEADLHRLLGIDGEGAIEPLAVLDPAPVPGASSATLTGLARTDRPERRALSDRVKAFQAREVAAGSGSKPQIALAGGYDYARPNPRIFPRRIGEWRDSWDVSVNVSWTLWDGGRRRAEYAEAARKYPRCASARARTSIVKWRSKCASAGSRSTPAAPRSRRPTTACGARRRRGVSWVSGSTPASPPAPKCSMPRSRCSRPSSIARGRSRTPGWPRRVSQRAVGR